jgi:preprotein translocase subunit SecA
MLAEGESLYSPSNIILMHHLNAALRATFASFIATSNTFVQNGEIVIVDEFTGRMYGGARAMVRRFAPGGGKPRKGVQIQAKRPDLRVDHISKLLSPCTASSPHDRHCGHRGVTSFRKSIRLETVVIPISTGPMIRIDSQDKVYRTLKEKLHSHHRRHQKTALSVGQPSCWSARRSIENSELLSNLLQKERLPHQVLNAKTANATRVRASFAQAGRSRRHHGIVRNQYGGSGYRHRALAVNGEKADAVRRSRCLHVNDATKSQRSRQVAR